MSTFLKDFYIHPIHVTKAQTRRIGKTLLSLNLNIRWRRVLSSFSRHFTPGKKTQIPNKVEAALAPETV
jgi:hypothetical protein